MEEQEIFTYRNKTDKSIEVNGVTLQPGAAISSSQPIANEDLEEVETDLREDIDPEVVEQERQEYIESKQSEEE